MSEDREAVLRDELTSCVLNTSSIYCLLGVGLSIPLGVRSRSLAPLIYLGIGGTIADLATGYFACAPQREALESCRRALLVTAEVHDPLAQAGIDLAPHDDQGRR